MTRAIAMALLALGVGCAALTRIDPEEKSCFRIESKDEAGVLATIVVPPEACGRVKAQRLDDKEKGLKCYALVMASNDTTVLVCEGSGAGAGEDSGAGEEVVR